MSRYETREEAEALLAAVDALILAGRSDVPALLLGLAERHFESYGLLLRGCRQLLRLARHRDLVPLLGRACRRYPNSIDLALLRVDATAMTGAVEGLEHLVRLTRETGRKRIQAARRLARLEGEEAAIGLLAAPGADEADMQGNALALALLHDRAGRPDRGDGILETLSRTHPGAAELQRARLRRAAFQRGAAGMIDAFRSLPAPDDGLLPTVLHELLHLGATAAACRFVATHGEARFGWPLHVRLALQCNQPDRAVSICRHEIGAAPAPGWSERDFSLWLQSALAAGDFGTAAVLGAAAARLYPASARLTLLRAQGLFREGDWPRATGLLRRATEIFPHSTPHRMALATMLVQTGDYAAARACLSELQGGGDEEDLALLDLRLARASGDLQQVRALAARMSGYSHAARQRAAIADIEAQLLKGGLAAAKAAAGGAIAAFPDAAELLLLAGKISFLAGDLEHARRIRADWAALTEAGDGNRDTHDLVLDRASGSGILPIPMPMTFPDRTGAEAGTGTGGDARSASGQPPDPQDPTIWMRSLYHRLQSGPAQQPEPGAETAIPPLLLRYWEGDSSPAVETIAAAWQARLPGFAPRVFDRATATRWLDDHGETGLAALVRHANAPAVAADIFRLAFLAREGGLYVDADEFPRAPIDDWLRGSTLLVTAEKGHFTVANSFIACTPGHPVIRDALARIERDGARFEGGLQTWMETGPGLLTLCLGQYLAGTSDPRGLRILRPQEYASRVSTTLQLPHKFAQGHWRHQDR